MEAPIETILEFVFYGSFIPKNFEPSWLYRAEILHPKDVKNIIEIKINEAEVFYSTGILSFNITYDSFVIKTNSALTYDSLLGISKRIVNVIKSDLSSEFNFNIRYHFKKPIKAKTKKNMGKLLKDSFWDGIVEDVTLQGAAISKSAQLKDFYWQSDINVSICKRADSKGELIHVFFRNFLNLEITPIKGVRTQVNRNIGKFVRLDNELAKVKNRCKDIAIESANKYFSDYV